MRRGKNFQPELAKKRTKVSQRLNTFFVLFLTIFVVLTIVELIQLIKLSKTYISLFTCQPDKMGGGKRKVPDCPLPCREQQFEEIIVFMRDNIIQENSRCMYVSGVPGTGKTVIVQAAIDQLKSHYSDLEFNYVYINGLSLGSRPDKLWKKLYKSLEVNKPTPNKKRRTITPLDKLNLYFEWNDILPTVLVVDELDQLMDKNQSVLYRLLEWTTNPQAKFTLIAIFNTMNLPEAALVNRNASRIGFSRVVFPPYDHSQLRTIVEQSLMDEKRKKSLSADALTLLSRKVAAISGDARRALEIAKRTLEILETSQKSGARAVDEAFKELFSSPKIDTMRDCSTLEKEVLNCVSSTLMRTGSDELCLGPLILDIMLVLNQFGMNASVDNIRAALTRLATLKLILMDTSSPFVHSQTKLSINVPLEDVKYAMDRHNLDKK